MQHRYFCLAFPSRSFTLQMNKSFYAERTQCANKTETKIDEEFDSRKENIVNGKELYKVTWHIRFNYTQEHIHIKYAMHLMDEWMVGLVSIC